MYMFGDKKRMEKMMEQTCGIIDALAQNIENAVLEAKSMKGTKYWLDLEKSLKSLCRASDRALRLFEHENLEEGA